LKEEQDDEYTFYGSKNGSLHIRCQSRSSVWSGIFKWRLITCEAKWNSKWIG
jgi:hypothetical protein